jgi:hypothetical protein
VPTPAEKLGLNQVAKFIINKNPEVRVIIHISTIDEPPFVYYLLIVVEGQKGSTDEIAVKIEQECAQLVAVVVFVKRTSWLVRLLAGKSNSFWYVVSPENVIYRSPLLDITGKLVAPMRLTPEDIECAYI